MSSTPPRPQPVSRVRLWWPVVAFILMIAWSNIPPYRAHIKHEKRGLMAWHWKLYHQGGLTYCDVRYFNMNAGGEALERWKVLGYERPGEMPDNIARTRDKGLYADYARVCKAMREAGDPEPNLQVYARCGVKLGWKKFERRKRNVCTAKPAAKAPVKPKVKTVKR
jgi:hypothetical protein